MAILKIHRNPHALTTEDKRILSDIHQYKHGGIYVLSECAVKLRRSRRRYQVLTAKQS